MQIKAHARLQMSHHPLPGMTTEGVFKGPTNLLVYVNMDWCRRNLWTGFQGTVSVPNGESKIKNSVVAFFQLKNLSRSGNYS